MHLQFVHLQFVHLQLFTNASTIAVNAKLFTNSVYCTILCINSLCIYSLLLQTEYCVYTLIKLQTGRSTAALIHLNFDINMIYTIN